MRTSALAHGPHIGRPLPVMGSFWSLDAHHDLISVLLHPTPTHAAFAHGG